LAGSCFTNTAQLRRNCCQISSIVKRISLLLVTAGLFIISSGFGADSSLVLDWNALMLDAIRLDDNGPTLSSRNLAILHGAIYDGINSIERSHQPYRYLVEAPSGTSEGAAALGAANEVIQSLYPSIRSRADTLYGFYLGS
jgi:hypothetical protein